MSDTIDLARRALAEKLFWRIPGLYTDGHTQIAECIEALVHAIVEDRVPVTRPKSALSGKGETMIDIIKRGTPYDDRYFKIICKRCLSHLKFKGDEVMTATDFRYIICPICKDAAEDGWINVKDAVDLPL